MNFKKKISGIKNEITQHLNVIFKSKELTELNENKKKKKAIILGTPTHGNLGDQAIIYAERKFIQKYLTEYCIIEIPRQNIISYIKCLKENTDKNDIIFYHGGGNMGTIYLYEEYIRRFVVKYLSKSRIISFPQSTSFNGDSLELRKTQKAYSKNKKFLLVAREQISKKYMEEKFKSNEVIMTPDIVFSLNIPMKNKNLRNGILTILRNDQEKFVDYTFEKKLLDKLRSSQKKVIVSDTHIGDELYIDENNRKSVLENIWNQYLSSKVVITDRLHGMIFAYITRTPCIVFRNNNPKIESTYKTWLSQCNFIKLIDYEVSIDEIVELIDTTSKIKPLVHKMDDHYLPLINYLRKK